MTAEHWSIAESAAKAKDQTAAKQAKASRPQVWDKPSSMYAGRASGSDLFPPEMRSAGILQQDHVTFTDGGDGTIGADPDRLAGVFDTLVGVSVSKAGGVVSSKRKRLAAVVENGEEEEEEGRASQRQGQQAERGFKKKIKTVGGNIQAHDDGPQGAGDKKALSQGSIDAENEHKLPMRPLAQGAHDGEETEPAVEDVQAQGDGTQDVGNERVEQQDPTLKVALPTKMRA